MLQGRVGPILSIESSDRNTRRLKNNAYDSGHIGEDEPKYHAILIGT